MGRAVDPFTAILVLLVLAIAVIGAVRFFRAGSAGRRHAEEQHMATGERDEPRPRHTVVSDDSNDRQWPRQPETSPEAPE